MFRIRLSHTLMVGLALVAGCADDSNSESDGTTGGETSTGVTSTTSSPTSGETGDASTSTAADETGDASSSDTGSSSTTGGDALAPRMSRYVEMADGTRIAIDVWLPPSAIDGAQVPTVMQMTRYWRAMEVSLPMFDESPAQAAAYTEHGFAYVTVDARGSGASFGTRQGPWQPDEREDHGEVVDWLVAQPWSNGNVGAIGVSYDGNTAAFLATVGRSAVKAVVPRFYDADAFDAPAFPGGVYNDGFVRNWSAFNQVLDSADVCQLAPEEDCATVMKVVLGPKWADEDPDGAMAAKAIAEHAGNLDVYQAGLGVTYRDDAFGRGPSLDDVSLRHQFGAFDDSGTALYSWGSWMDGGTADSALNVFAGTSGSHRVILGGWNHGADEDADPFLASDQAVEPSVEDQHQDIIDFLAAHLQDDAEPAAVREIRYVTMNDGTWRTTDVWPPADVQPTTLYFAPDGLQQAAPSTGQQDYAVDYTANTGATNRWWTQMSGGDVAYADRASEDDKLLTFTGEPLAEDTRVTGHPEVTVHLSTDRDDGALFVYLEDVAPDGSVTYITEGQLRFVHRAVDPQSPELHSFAAADGQAVVPGETMELTVRLRPTSVRLEAGHRVRVALAGADASNFARYPAEGDASWTVLHGDTTPSRVILPIAE